jgi:hypothetical protein
VGKRTLRLWAVAILALLPGAALPAQEPAGAEESAPEADSKPPSHWRLGVGVKSHYRDSDANSFRSPFPFEPEQVPVGRDRVLLETVDPGHHLEFSTITLLIDGDWGRRFAAHAKIDGIDRYDRNPTSTDHEIDVDELWLRFGPETEPVFIPEQPGAYLKLGKFGHFERQNDRHLESYGLVSTAFNRFEDEGLEAGLDLGRWYLKFSYTQGNPLFIRDPNALAGDNGTPAFQKVHPDPALRSGIVILYDAEVEAPDFKEPEAGAGIGVRFGDGIGRRGADLLVWGYRRDLADTVDLEGTFYGGDLDLLDGPSLPPPFPRASLPIHGHRKSEVGGNLWLHFDGLSFFGQYVDQEVAGMKRTGYEGELAWRIDLPLVWGIAGRQLFPSIAPAVRYSRLDPDFDGGGPFPAVSVRWEWTKIDAGLRFGVIDGLDATVEYADHRFFVPSLRKNGSNNEFLATLRFRR